MPLGDFIENKLNHYAETIQKGGAQLDEHALGEMSFYMALRRVTEGKAHPQDTGTMDAVNDTLQELGLVEPASNFLKSGAS